jgi:hypothetical protein
MEIDDADWTPQARAAEIHRQLGELPPPISVHQIAQALDIHHIREEPLTNFEGCLVTDPERSAGDILVNSGASKPRRRYTIAHELGHFLCTWHKSGDEGSFRCSRSDMTVSRGQRGRDLQEAEANQFAIELLAPKRFLSKHLRRLPELERNLSINKELDISKAAAARRYVELHPEPLAVVFAQHDRFLYAHRGAAFPWLPFSRDDTMPKLPATVDGENLSQMTEVDPLDWLRPGAARELAVQVLRQENSHAMILLQAAEPRS